MRSGNLEQTELFFTIQQHYNEVNKVYVGIPIMQAQEWLGNQSEYRSEKNRIQKIKITNVRK